MSVLASEKVKKGDIVIFSVDEYRNGNKSEFDGNVVLDGDGGVEVIYLSGYRSRNDFIPWADVLAKVDKRKPRVELPNTPYSGHFEIFKEGQ